MSSNIRVAVRCRPLFGAERPAIGLDVHGRRILLDSKTYDPDYTFAMNASQDDVFEVCRPLLQCVTESGLNGTIMVYGQTGTGKTYTMLGSEGTVEGGSGAAATAGEGVVYKVVAHLLEHVQRRTLDGGQCALTLSMVEIYNERLTDMLSPDGSTELTLVSGFPRFAEKRVLCNMADARAAIRQGLIWRHTAATMMNECSSRSHVVFIVDLEELNLYTDEMDVAHIFLVDLAGSESLKKSQATGATAGEAGKINKSLLALKSVLLALSNTNEATRPAHVPYRDSKLTELLQDSIGGAARTLMIACISPVGRDIEETKSTLMYAVKARSIRNAANTEKERLLVRLRTMEGENQRLRNRLQERVSERGGYYVTREEHEHTQRVELDTLELRRTVERLVKDSQVSDARKHISESQAKVLQDMLESKEKQLVGLQTLYQEALFLFERHGLTLQQVVQTTVGEVRRLVQGSAAAGQQRLIAWRNQALRMLDAPLQVETTDTDTSSCSGSGSGSVAQATTSAAAPPLPVISPRSSVARGAPSSLATSPARRNAPRRASALGQRPGPPSSPPLQRESAEDAASFLAPCDSDCRRIAARINRAFVDLFHEVVDAQERCTRLTRQAEERRAQETERLCEVLQGQLAAGLKQLERVQLDAAGHVKAAQEDVESYLTAVARYPAPADPQPLQHTVRNACLALVRQAECLFPEAEAPAEVQRGLDHVLRAHQAKLAAMSVAATAPLTSVAVAGARGGGTSAETPAATDDASALPLPPLAPATATDSSPSQEDSACWLRATAQDENAGSPRVPPSPLKARTKQQRGDVAGEQPRGRPSSSQRLSRFSATIVNQAAIPMGGGGGPGKRPRSLSQGSRRSVHTRSVDLRRH